MKRFITVIFLLCLTLGSVAQSADSLKSLIYYHYDRSEFVEAISYAERVLAYYESQNDLYDMAGCYNIMGVAYQRMGQFDEAIDSYNRSCELMEELRQTNPTEPFYEKNIRYTQNNIAAIYSDMGEYDQSAKMYRRCMEMLGTPSDTTGYLDMATYLQNLADVLLIQSKTMEGKERKEQLEEAERMAEQAYDYSVRYGDLPFKLLYRMMTLSNAYFHLGRVEEAFVTAQEGLDRAEREEDLYLQADFHLLLASFYVEQKDYVSAERESAVAVALAREGNYEESEYKGLKLAYMAAKEFDQTKALDYFEQSVQLKDSIFNLDQQRLIRDYQARYELAEKDHQIEIQQERNKRHLWFSIVLLILALLLGVLLVIWIRLNRLNRRQKETLKSLNEAKDKLLSISSHDVKTSVIAQNMVLDQLYHHCDSMDVSQLKENILALKTSSDALKDKLTNLLQWVMIELGGRESHPESFNLSQLVNTCLNFMTAELTAKEVGVEVHVSPDLQCLDDKNIIGIVLQNLVSNAIKFSNQGGTISLSAEEESQKVWITVADRGVGIPDEKLRDLSHDIVESTQGTSGETGTGIGLMVCRQLLERNQGTMIINSTEGQGTQVRFSVNKQLG